MTLRDFFWRQTRSGISRLTRRSSRQGLPRGRTARRERFLRMESLEDRRVLTAGDLDTTFGNGGYVTSEFFGAPNSTEGALAVALQSDGKIVAAGEGGVVA